MKNKSNIFGECVAEFIGTAILLMFGVGCVAALVLTGASFGQWEISILWGLAVALAIYCTGGISGAHINPAVTLALAAFHGFDKKKVGPYILAQMLGGFFGVVIVYALYQNLFVDFELVNGITRGSQESLATAGIFSTYPNPLLSFSGAFAVEFVITAMLMFGILAITDDKNGGPNKAMAPLLIGLLIATIGGCFGPLTGFAMNPARDFGPKIFAFLAGWGDVALTGGRDIPYFIVPILAPIAGGLFGGWLYPKVISAYLPSADAAEVEIIEEEEAEPVLININDKN